jgi:hypothetical protein
VQYNFPYQGDARSMKQILASNGYHHWNFPETQPTFYESVLLHPTSLRLIRWQGYMIFASPMFDFKY